MIRRPTVNRDAKHAERFFQSSLTEILEYQFTMSHRSPNEMPSLNVLPFDKEERK